MLYASTLTRGQRRESSSLGRDSDSDVDVWSICANARNSEKADHMTTPLRSCARRRPTRRSTDTVTKDGSLRRLEQIGRRRGRGATGKLSTPSAYCLVAGRANNQPSAVL